jgi:hypothetical protein
MAPEVDRLATPDEGRSGGPFNGAALAALLAAGIGALSVGLFVILNEAAAYAAPSLYGPAGGVSGRTTFATGVWLLSWWFLHRAWRGRQLKARGVYLATAAMILLGLLLTFPPLWGIL